MQRWLGSGAAVVFLVAAASADDARPPGPATARRVGATLQNLDVRAKATQEQLQALAGRARELDAMTIARGRSFVRLARAGLLPVGGGFSELVDHAARLERLHRALERDLAETEAIARERQRLAKVLTELDAQRELLESERSALARSHAAIRAAEERDEAFRRAFQSTAATDHTAVYAGGPASGTADVSRGFQASKGRLPFPLAGRAEIRRGARPGAGPGLEMAAPAGSVVRPVYPGRVAFADDYPGFGHTVILEHGGGYFSLYAGLAGSEVRAGEEVPVTQAIGRIGSGGALYLEIRQGQTPLDPSPWFGL